MNENVSAQADPYYDKTIFTNVPEKSLKQICKLSRHEKQVNRTECLGKKFELRAFLFHFNFNIE